MATTTTTTAPEWTCMRANVTAAVPDPEMVSAAAAAAVTAAASRVSDDDNGCVDDDEDAGPAPSAVVSGAGTDDAEHASDVLWQRKVDLMRAREAVSRTLTTLRSERGVPVYLQKRNASAAYLATRARALVDRLASLETQLTEALNRKKPVTTPPVGVESSDGGEDGAKQPATAAAGPPLPHLLQCGTSPGSAKKSRTPKKGRKERRGRGSGGGRR